MNRLIHKTPLQDNVVKGERKEILISFPNQSNVTGRNRMHVAVDDKHYSYYAYDYSGGSCGSREQSQACLSYAEMEQRRRGQRRIKLTGDNSVLDVNADFMRSVSTFENVTLYPSAYMVLTDRGYTKHYYTGMERVAARIGDGGLDVGFYLSNTDSLHARANRLFSQSLAQVNRRVLEANDVDCIMDGEMPVEELGIPFEAIPEQMSATVGTEYGEFVGAMHLVSNAGESPEVYYYHGDHLGSASWITDASGTAVQHLQYLPFGERFVDQRTSGYSERFTFTGKERDSETGYGYFGARYMDYELITMWLSVDPMADKYPNISPYAYCNWNPVKLVDPDGRDVILVIWASHNGKIGHAGIAISNYREEIDANGQTQMVPDGTYTYRDLWPRGGVGKDNFSENVPAQYDDYDKVTLDQLLTEDVTGGEERPCDGLILFTTDFNLDTKIQQSLDDFEESNPSYNALKVNCSDYVEAVLETMAGKQLPVDEKLTSKTSATTPNQVYKTAATLKNGRVLKDLGNKVNNGFIRAVAGGPIKEKIAESILD